MVDREADKKSGKLFIDRLPPLSAAKRRSQPIPVTAYAITLEQLFWIEFKTDISSSRLIALQQCGSDWAYSSAEYDAAEKRILIPGLREDGFPASFYEDEWLDLNTFYVLQLAKPWSGPLLDAIKNKLPLDGNFLQAVSDHYMTENPTQRRLFAIDITVNKSPSS